MNNWTNNNYTPQMSSWNLPHYESPLLKGRNDAENFRIGPNSSIYLPDADENIIWWIRTDSSGQRTVMPFDVSPHQEPKPVDLNEIVRRLDDLEARINAKSNKSNAKRNGSNANANANESD